MTEAIAGRADSFFGPVALVLPRIREGRLTALAVNTEKRSPALPDVPTPREAGIRDALSGSARGLVLVVEKELHLAEEVHAVLFHDDRVRALAELDIALVRRAGKRGE